MLGVLIGDLAAWTYDHKRDSVDHFYVHPDARFSETGLGLLATCRTAKETLGCLPQLAYVHLEETVGKAVDSLPLKVGNYDIFEEIPEGKDQEEKSFYRLCENLLLGSMINEGTRIEEPSYKDTGYMCSHQNDWMIALGSEKPEYYMSQISMIIARLRNGATKEQALIGTACIKIEDDEHKPLGYVNDAWKCFEQSTDFWSAVSSAILTVPYPDTHKAAALAGAFADAMYGCPEVELPVMITKYFKTELELLVEKPKKKGKKTMTETDEVKKIIEAIGTENELLLVANVAGWGWHNGDSVWGMLKPGKKLRLVREASNKHDKQAVALYFSNTKIGYVPKKDNAKIAELLDDGKKHQLQARIMSATTYQDEPKVKFYIFKTPEL